MKMAKGVECLCRDTATGIYYVRIEVGSKAGAKKFCRFLRAADRAASKRKLADLLGQTGWMTPGVLAREPLDLGEDHPVTGPDLRGVELGRFRVNIPVKGPSSHLAGSLRMALGDRQRSL